MFSKLSLFINKNEYLTALYMLSSGQEVGHVAGVRRMLTVPYNIHHFVNLRKKRKHVYEPPTSPLFTHSVVLLT